MIWFCMWMNYLNSLIIVLKLIDDLLDFTSHESVMGKPTAADLKLGLATAPVLYAAQVRQAQVWSGSHSLAEGEKCPWDDVKQHSKSIFDHKSRN